MKKAISILLVLVMIISMSILGFAEENSEKYYTIQVEYSDNIGCQESLDIMIKNNNVFVNAEMLAERLGYTFGENGEGVVIINKEESDSLPFGITKFKYNSTQVSHMLFNKMLDSYEAPFACVKNNKGSWIPFEYSILLFNSNMMITDDAVLIDIPDKSIIDYFFDISKNTKKYNFDWAEDFEYENVKLMNESSHLINVFNSVLDSSSWVSLFQQFAGRTDLYDEKYGENLAMILCTESEKELQMSADQVGVPFVENGLSDVDSFELALCSTVFQSDNFLNYLNKRNSVFNDTENIRAENLYDLSQYCYKYLKSCYMTREAALNSLTNKPGSIKESIQPLIDYQNSINTEISKLMVELKKANNTNDSFVFGFLPRDNEEYLIKYDDSRLIKWIEAFNKEDFSLFGLLPSEFVFSSGAGGWATELTLNNNGTFKGQYHDSDMGDSGVGYSNGTVYICDFSGKFTAPQKINEYIYSMKLESLNVDTKDDKEYYENDIRYIYSEPYGFDNADEFFIYLPGCPLAETSEEFLSWSFIDTRIRDTIPMGVYGIYNVGGMEGFMGVDDDAIWEKTYIYSYNSYKSELQPSYYYKSHLKFCGKSGATELVLEFDWNNDEQTEFVAYDYRGTGEYNISLDFKEALSSVSVTVKSMSGFNLEPWGGTSDGVILAEYHIQ